MARHAGVKLVVIGDHEKPVRAGIHLERQRRDIGFARLRSEMAEAAERAELSGMPVSEKSFVTTATPASSHFSTNVPIYSPHLSVLQRDERSLERTLKRDLVARELGKVVVLRSDPDEEVLDPRGDGGRAVGPAAAHVLEHGGFDTVGTSQPPCTDRDALGELDFDRVSGFECGDDLADEGFEVFRRFVAKHNLAGGEAVLQGIHPASGAALGRLGAGAELGIAAIGFDLQLAGHVSAEPRRVSVQIDG